MEIIQIELNTSCWVQTEKENTKGKRPAQLTKQKGQKMFKEQTSEP